MDPRVAIGNAGLEEKHAVPGLGKPRGDDAPGRTRADDDEIESLGVVAHVGLRAISSGCRSLFGSDAQQHLQLVPGRIEQRCETA